MTRERFGFAAVLLALCAVFGCSGGDDSPTDAVTACAQPWAGQRAWLMRGGCPGSSGEAGGISTGTFSNCTLVMDVTPQPEKARGATWTLTANFQAGTAQVVRANTDCPGTDTGSVRVVASSAIAELQAPNNPACTCRLVYNINVPRPL